MKQKDKKETRAYIITDAGIKVMIQKDINNNRNIVKDNKNEGK